MQKLKAIITGSKVHDVGYRVMLVNKALSYGVNNFNTFNTYFNGTQIVIAIIEAEDDTIEDFKNFVTNSFPKKAIIDNISFEEYHNTVPPIERAMQAFQMEQWGKAIPVLVEMLDKQDKSLELQKKTLEKQDKMLEKQDKMLEKQDLHIEITRNGFTDLMKKQDESLKILDHINMDTSEVKSTLKTMEMDIRDARFSLSRLIETKFKEHDAEIAQIKRTLTQVQEAVKAI